MGAGRDGARVTAPESQTISGAGWGRRVGVTAGLYAIGAGAVTLVGWAANMPRLTDWDGNGISMFPNSAVAAIAAGLAVLLMACGCRAAAAAPGVLAGVIGGASIFQHLTGTDLGIDTILWYRDFGHRAAATPGRMGPPASTMFTILG